MISKLKWLFRAWRYRLKLEPREISLLLSHLQPGDTALDIGAHKGAYTYWMRRAVGATGSVIAFEPQPALARQLRDLTATGHWRNVAIENLGLSSKQGQMQLNVPSHATSPGASLEASHAQPDQGQAYPVQVTTLDDYLQAHPVRNLRLVKCDAEGHELEVFRGAQDTLTRHRPHLLFECERRHRASGDVGEVFRFLQSLDYQGWFLDRSGQHAIGQFNAEVHQAQSGSPAYVNNFLFSPLDRT